MIKKSQNQKKLKGIALLCLISILVSGCASSKPDKSTESVTVNSAGNEETSSTDASEESMAETGTSAPVSYITGSETLEALVPSLWGRMLQYCGVTQVCMADYEDWGKANEDFLQMQFDSEYVVEVYLTRIASSKANKMEIYVFYDHFGCAYSWRWLERDEGGKEITITPDLYPEADKYWETHIGYEEVGHYTTSDFVAGLIAPAKIKIAGEIRKIAYEKGQNWSDELEWMPYGMWGSVMKEAGLLYMEENGTVLGNLNGHAYMMSFENGTMTGTFWVCLEGRDPVQMVFVIDYEGFVYEVQLIEDAVFSDTEKENAWLSLEWDLVTEQLKK